MARRSLKQVKTALQRHWRENGRRAHVPESLRRSAIGLLADHPRALVVKELQVALERLRRWQMKDQERGQRKPDAQELVSFVEIPPIAHPYGTPLTDTLELVSPDGWQLRVSGGLAGKVAGQVFAGFHR